MIIQMFLDVLFNIFSTLTTAINIPPLPDEVNNYITQFFDYLESGAGILANYTNFGYIMVLFGLILAIDIGIKLYHFVMWVLRKIPVAGIE